MVFNDHSILLHSFQPTGTDEPVYHDKQNNENHTLWSSSSLFHLEIKYQMKYGS